MDEHLEDPEVFFCDTVRELGGLQFRHVNSAKENPNKPLNGTA